MRCSILRIGFLGVLALWSSISCQPEADLEVMVPLPNSEWPYSRAVVIPYFNTDTLRSRHVLLRFRHSGDYPYRNLHTLCQLSGPAGDSMVFQTGTMLSDPEGKWLGQSTIGDLYTISDTMTRSIKFSKTGLYTFRIYQHMRINPVPALEEVGLSIR
jgi:gliding motility-associated lipoprotein GldH